MKTLVVGRSPFADVVIADPGVAPHHAELVVTDDGRLHLTDCSTATGTWRLTGDDGDWEKIRQVFIGEDDEIRVGDYRCRASEIVRLARAREATERGDGGGIGPGGMPSGAAVTGRVQRDPVTGEIVRRRF